MQEAPPGEAGFVVDQGAEFLVAEVVGGVAPVHSRTALHLLDDAVPDQLFERRHHHFLVPAARRLHGIEVERAPDDCGGVEQLTGTFGDGREAGAEEVSHTAGQSPRGVIPAKCPFPHRRKVLTEEER